MMGADREQRHASILQLANILSTRGVRSEIVDKVRRESMIGETAHSTHKSPQRMIAEKLVAEDAVVREYLHKIYFFDYVIFPFRRDRLDGKYQTDFWKKKVPDN
uniref:Uncharacterized protein n=1 Tax=Caenorhabditis japonica TaxID=281687 RepID=A0A8R1EJW1_CAEJA